MTISPSLEMFELSDRLYRWVGILLLIIIDYYLFFKGYYSLYQVFQRIHFFCVMLICMAAAELTTTPPFPSDFRDSNPNT